MTGLAVVLAYSASLGGCASPSVPGARSLSALEVDAPAGYTLGTTRELAAVPIDAGLGRYRVVDLQDPALRIPASVLQIPSNDKSFLPSPDKGRITQDTWQRARIQDGRVIDACVKSFVDLSDQFKAYVGTVRGD